MPSAAHRRPARYVPAHRARQARRPSMVACAAIVAGMVASLGLSAQVASALPGTVLYVNASATGTGTCLDPADACTTIQVAINVAETDTGGDVTIDVAAGDYSEADTIAASALGSLTIDGAGPASTTVTPPSGSSGFTVNSGTVSISGLTISGATISGTEFTIYGVGGAIYNTANLTASDDTFSEDASPQGGAIASTGNVAAIDDTFVDDSAPFGGAMFNAGTASIANDTFVDDTAPGFCSTDGIDPGAGEGGAIFNTDTLVGTFDTFLDDTGYLGPSAGSGNPCATVDGGGTYTSSGASMGFSNSIFDGTTEASGLTALGPVTDGGYNVETAPDTYGFDAANHDTVLSGSAVPDLSTTLAANGSNGRETLAITPGNPTSPAFEEVAASACQPSVPTADGGTVTITSDELGNPRPGVPGQTSCDAGAFEYQQSFSLTGPGTQTSYDGQTITPLSLVLSDSASNPVTYSATGLPPVLSINPATGLITGTIADTADETSPYSVTVSAADGTTNATASQSFSWDVPDAVSLINPGAQTSTVGTGVNLQIEGTDAENLPLTYIATGLPPGLSINSTTGLISGTPTAHGPPSVTVTASDSIDSASVTFDWQVNSATQAPSITSPSSTSFVVGSAGSFTVTTTGAPTPAITESGKLPSGVTFTDNGNGTATISTPRTGTKGTYPITITASNGVSPNATQSFTLTVKYPTTLSVLITPSPDKVGSALIAAAVLSADDSGGTVSFSVSFDGGPSSAIASCQNKPVYVVVSDCVYAPTSQGTYTIGASFSGDTSFAPSSGSASVKTLLPTALALSFSASPHRGSALVVSAKVSPTPNSGTVAFAVEAPNGQKVSLPASCSSAVLNAGVANCSFTPSQDGTYTVSAVYSGSSVYAPSSNNATDKVTG
jgi:large repetitive protein